MINAVPDPIVQVQETADGALAIEVIGPRTHGFAGGRLPTDQVPIGVSKWNDDVFVASVGPNVGAVRVTLTDGAVFEAELHVVANSAAQYVIVPLADGAKPHRLVALDFDGSELAAHDYE